MQSFQASASAYCSRRTLIVSCVALGALLLFFQLVVGYSPRSPALLAPYDQDEAQPLRDVLNATLGFQKVFVVHLQERSDRRDLIDLAAAYTNISLTWTAAVRGQDIDGKAMPPGDGSTLNNGQKGSWRSHMNVLQTIVEQNITSALIFEDDIDWDMRIKQQMRDFALSTRALTQPLVDGTAHNTFADRTFPSPPASDPNLQPDPLSLAALPTTVKPAYSPYGDNWDVLWPGHCGQRQPRLDRDSDSDWFALSRPLPRGSVIHRDDMTVPPAADVHNYDDQGYGVARADFADHSRIVHHSMNAVCSFAYAVTQAGARRMLYHLALERFDQPFDLGLRAFCDRRDAGYAHTCLTVRPPLFYTHLPKGPHSRESELAQHADGEQAEAKTLNIRWSVVLNLPKLVNGETDYIDQYPD